MATNSWKDPTGGDWNTATLWSAGTVPANGDDVVIDAPNPTGAYTVTIGATETVIVNTLTLNAPGDGTNQPNYAGAVLEVDGTLEFEGAGKGAIGGSFQSMVISHGGTFVNAGTVAPFFLCDGNVLFTGTNGFYVESELQSLGTVIVDTKNIDELIGNTLTDGIYSSVGPDSVIELGGTLEGLNVDITKMQGPAIDPSLGFIGWTELTLDGPNAQIYQWQTATSTYIGIEATLNDIGARGTLDVLNGRNYSTTQSMTVEAQGMLNLQAGTVTMGGLTVAGILEGTGTITNAVTNNGTISVLSGTLADGTTKTTVLDIAGALSGTGTVEFDHDEKAGTVVATGGTLMVGTVAAGQNILMNGDDTLVLAQAGAFLGTIDAKIGDRIILQGMTATSAVDNNGTLVISNGTATVATLKVAGDMASDSFTASGSIITVGSAAATSGQFTVDDATTKQVTTVAGVPYNGPVAGLTSQYVFPTTDQVMVKAQTPNVFIQVGQLGQKNPLIAGIDVSAANGNNVLDCYANSSFLIDGTGIDQNYIDARGATQNSWSTVVNFHAGDNVTIWGLTAQDFKLQWIGDTYGADGAKGLTGVYTPNTGTLAIGITLAGYTMADVSNGKLTVSYSKIDGNDYASIHANTPA